MNEANDVTIVELKYPSFSPVISNQLHKIQVDTLPVGISFIGN
jgi:hypothetical protein